MPLIKSISGVRGTIGGKGGTALTPVDIVAITVAFGKWLQQQNNDPATIVLGRDARSSGPMISKIVAATLQSIGINVVDLGLSTTPTVAMSVPMEKGHGGIVITASHNPIAWNALKLLNDEGTFLNAEANQTIFRLANRQDHSFADIHALGSYRKRTDYIDQHIEKIVALPLVAVEAIQKKKFRIAVDGINSTGGIAVPQLLKALGVGTIKKCNCVPTGNFAHNPEPLPENLTKLSRLVAMGDYDLGIAVDPDVDRLAILDEKGEAWGEDYTLVGVVDYVLQHQPGNVVSNLSSTNALKDITLQHGGSYVASAVGEVNVVAKMKETEAVIGGEGNGGVIYPLLHCSRDALVGIALLLSHLATTQKTASALRKSYPNYFTIKDKVPMPPNCLWDSIVERLKAHYSDGYEFNTEDGFKIMQNNGWVHLRMSNTEPIIRVYAEASTKEQATQLAKEGVVVLNTIISSLR